MLAPHSCVDSSEGSAGLRGGGPSYANSGASSPPLMSTPSPAPSRQHGGWEARLWAGCGGGNFTADLARSTPKQEATKPCPSAFPQGLRQAVPQPPQTSSLPKAGLGPWCSTTPDHQVPPQPTLWLSTSRARRAPAPTPSPTGRSLPLPRPGADGGAAREWRHAKSAPRSRAARLHLPMGSHVNPRAPGRVSSACGEGDGPGPGVGLRAQCPPPLSPRA